MGERRARREEMIVAEKTGEERRGEERGGEGRGGEERRTITHTTSGILSGFILVRFSSFMLVLTKL